MTMTTHEMIQAPTAGKGIKTPIPRIAELSPATLAAATIANGGTLTMTHEAVLEAFYAALKANKMETRSVKTKQGSADALWFLVERRIRQGLYQQSNHLPEGQRFLLEANMTDRKGNPCIVISIVDRDAD